MTKIYNIYEIHEQYRCDPYVHEIGNGIIYKYARDSDTFETFIWLKGTHVHRLFEPATINFKNGKYDSCRWQVKTCDCTVKFYNWFKENGIDPYNMTEEDKELIKMRWDF